MAIITADEIRRTCGITSDQISDDDLNGIIAEVEDQVPRFLNTRLIPKETIDVLDGDGREFIFLKHNPVLTVRALKIDGTTIGVKKSIEFYRESGLIKIDTVDGDPDISYFKDKPKSVVVKYVYGFQTESEIHTESTSDVAAGTSVTISVDNASEFSTGEWITIKGMDGNEEAAKITSTSSGQITVDQLIYDHESGSIVTKLEIREVMKRLLRIVASISAVARVVGESSKDITGYSIEGFSVQKGEPYTQWRETANQLISERDQILKRIKTRVAIR